MEKLSDEQLLHRVRAGDESAFKELVRKYEPCVAATVYGMLGSCPEAEDVGQETFIRFYTSLHRFRGESSIATYLTRIAINLSLNELRRLKRNRTLFSKNMEQAVEKIPASDTCEQSDMKAQVEQALHALESKFRAVVILRIMEGYSTKETAHILGVAEGTVLSRLSRAQKKLLKVMSVSGKNIAAMES